MVNEPRSGEPDITPHVVVCYQYHGQYLLVHNRVFTALAEGVMRELEPNCPENLMPMAYGSILTQGEKKL
jgi:hypothetical protein